MFSKLKSTYGRPFGVLRSAQQKTARRCEKELMTAFSLEIARTNTTRNGEVTGDYSKAAISYMLTILMEDKFNGGMLLIRKLHGIVDAWGKFDKQQRELKIVQMCADICATKSDRHSAYLARVALYLVQHDERKPENEEELLAKEVETIISRLPKKSEMPTGNDYKVYQKDFPSYKNKQVGSWDGMDQLYDLLFTKRDGRKCLEATALHLFVFNQFKYNWFRSKKSTLRLYIYTLVGTVFYGDVSGKPMYVPTPIPELKPLEIPDYCYDKHTKSKKTWNDEGDQKKRGMKHFLVVGAHVKNVALRFDERRRIKKKAEGIYLDYEKKWGTKHANSRHVRKRIRERYNELTTLHGEKVVKYEYCQVPCGGKPRTMYVSTEEGNLYFVKGPYRDTDPLAFQVELDGKKKEYDILPMDVTIQKENNLYYLVAPVKANFVNVSLDKTYNEEILWNLTKVLIMRAVFNVSDTNLRNVMINPLTNEVLSVDEMSNKRTAPRGDRLVDYLFNKPPRKSFCEQLMTVIDARKEEYDAEVRRYNGNNSFLLYKTGGSSSSKRKR